MKTPRRRIAKAVADRTLSKGLSQQLSRELAAYLLVERRVGELDSLLRDVQADWAEAGVVEVIASSAYELTPAIRQDIETKVQRLYPSAKQIIVSEAHNPEVIGGVRLSLANQQLDLTIEAKLNKFKQLTAGKD